MKSQKLFVESNLPADKREDGLFLTLRKFLSGLSDKERDRFFKEYIVPVMGEEAAATVRQQAAAERDQLQKAIEERQARDRGERGARVPAQVAKMQFRALQELQGVDRGASFQDPLLALVWEAIKFSAGIEIGNAGPHVALPSGATDMLDFIQQFLTMQRMFCGQEHEDEKEWNITLT